MNITICYEGKLKRENICIFRHPYITEAEKDLIEISQGKRQSFFTNAVRLPSPESYYPSQNFPVNESTSTFCTDEHLIRDDCDTNVRNTSRKLENQKSMSSTLDSPNGSFLSIVGDKVPWSHIFRSPPFWAILLCNVPQTYGFYTILTELPTYMSQILHFSLNEVGVSETSFRINV